MGPLPETTNGNRHLLVVIDHFTKWCEVFPTKDQKQGRNSRVHEICQLMGTHKAPFTLHRYNFCIGTERVTVQPRFHCSSAKVVPDSLTVYAVPVAFVNQIAVLLLHIVKEQKYVSHVLTTRHSIVRSLFS